MVVTQRISEREYQDLVLREPVETWELHDGQLVEKPGRTWDHDEVVIRLGTQLSNQLDRRRYRVRVEGRVRRPGTIFRPDVFVVPTAYGDEFRGRPGVLAIFNQPLPLVVEIWSRSTGSYDVNAKIPIYQERGDLEIWRIHPYERTLTAWRRQPDGTYEEHLYREGIVRTVSLPNVAIDLGDLFDEVDG
jgi:Uma2 family endonuclease